MQVVLRVVDYGPFRDAEISFKPLTLVIGRNSTGKSLLMYTYVVLARALNPLNLLAFGKPRGVEELSSVARKYVEYALPKFLGKSVCELVRVGSERARLELSSSLGRVVVWIARDEGVADVRLELGGPAKEFVKAAMEMSRGLRLLESFDAFKSLALELGRAELLEPYYAPLILPDSRSGVLRVVSKLEPYAALLALREADPDLELALFISALIKALEKGDLDLEIAAPLLRDLGIEKVESVEREIVVTLWPGARCSLPSAPSGVREALPIALTLAMRTPSEVIIEEPEAHLHPAAIRALARVIARAVNRGKRIAIATHSDTLLASINNLLMLSGKREKARSMSYSEVDLISSEMVAAYATKREEGFVELRRLSIDETGIDEREFAEVLEDLANERAEILA